MRLILLSMHLCSKEPGNGIDLALVYNMRICSTKWHNVKAYNMNAYNMDAYNMKTHNMQACTRASVQRSRTTRTI